VVVRKKSSLRVVFTLDLLMQSIAVEVDGEELEPVRSSSSLMPVTMPRTVDPWQRNAPLEFQLP
jgi:hypothetical protein